MLRFFERVHGENVKHQALLDIDCGVECCVSVTDGIETACRFYDRGACHLFNHPILVFTHNKPLRRPECLSVFKAVVEPEQQQLEPYEAYDGVIEDVRFHKDRMDDFVHGAHPTIYVKSRGGVQGFCMPSTCSLKGARELADLMEAFEVDMFEKLKGLSCRAFTYEGLIDRLEPRVT